ncbi:hypothetical protein C8R44DRAFT_744984 [Mycena epipterygia]|nr:hypothetical protein C8R44DRAFT_744984 [Mycena epipterygia]
MEAARVYLRDCRWGARMCTLREGAARLEQIAADHSGQGAGEAARHGPGAVEERCRHASEWRVSAFGRRSAYVHILTRVCGNGVENGSASMRSSLGDSVRYRAGGSYAALECAQDRDCEIGDVESPVINFGHMPCGSTINMQSKERAVRVGDGRPIGTPLDGPLPTTIWQSHNSYKQATSMQPLESFWIQELDESIMPCGRVRAFNRQKLKFQCQKPRRGPIHSTIPPSANFGNIVVVQQFHQRKRLVEGALHNSECTTRRVLAREGNKFTKSSMDVLDILEASTNIRGPRSSWSEYQYVARIIRACRYILRDQRPNRLQPGSNHTPYRSIALSISVIVNTSQDIPTPSLHKAYLHLHLHRTETSQLSANLGDPDNINPWHRDPTSGVHRNPQTSTSRIHSIPCRTFACKDIAELFIWEFISTGIDTYDLAKLQRTTQNGDRIIIML